MVSEIEKDPRHFVESLKKITPGT
ncbi:hypothetical protein ACVR0O_01545 [Streptococcus caviae]